MREYIFIAYKLLCLLLSVYGAYFAAVSLCCFMRKSAPCPADRQLRFAVLIAARNEERCIAGIVESIKKQRYPAELTDIYVIPNQCTDNTEAIAAAAGADILRVSPRVRCKGEALHEAFAQLLKTGRHDAYCVFDADNEADPAFIAAMNRALAAGARAAKGRILAKNACESWVCACYEAHFCSANLWLNSSRRNLRLSARLIGTGFALRRDLLQDLGGWNTSTLTEDAEFYAMLCARGERIAYVPEAITYDEEPASFTQSMVQRRRWMSGIMKVWQLKASELFRSAATAKGGLLAFDALAQLSFTYLQAWIIPCFLSLLCACPGPALSTLAPAALRFYALAFLAGGAALLLEGRLTRRTAMALFLYPAFVFSFLPLETLSLFLHSKSWRPIRHSGVRLHGIRSRPE